eukprot:m.757839 g.757839  ORF g.757839 m.757839 type:complete len:362 (-) comp23191_c0_seq1:1067-2152(-)
MWMGSAQTGSATWHRTAEVGERAVQVVFHGHSSLDGVLFAKVNVAVHRVCLVQRRQHYRVLEVQLVHGIVAALVCVVITVHAKVDDVQVVLSSGPQNLSEKTPFRLARDVQGVKQKVWVLLLAICRRHGKFVLGKPVGCLLVLAVVLESQIERKGSDDHRDQRRQHQCGKVFLGDVALLFARDTHQQRDLSPHRQRKTQLQPRAPGQWRCREARGNLAKEAERVAQAVSNNLLGPHGLHGNFKSNGSAVEDTQESVLNAFDLVVPHVVHLVRCGEAQPRQKRPDKVEALGLVGGAGEAERHEADENEQHVVAERRVQPWEQVVLDDVWEVVQRQVPNHQAANDGAENGEDVVDGRALFERA